MKDPVVMEVFNSLDDLLENEPDVSVVQRYLLAVYQLREVADHIFEAHEDAVLLHKDILELDYVLVVYFLQDFELSYTREIYPSFLLLL